MNYTITKEQILELENRAEKGCTNVIKSNLKGWFPDAFKPELKSGQWYIASCYRTNGYLILAAEITDNNKVTSNCWFSPAKSYVDVTGLFDSVERLATEEEVSAALIAEAKKRGFVEGVKFIGLDGDIQTLDRYDFWNIDKLNANPEHKFNLGGAIQMGVIFRQGKWAEILPEEKKDITKEKTLEIIKGEKYICRKEVVINESRISFKRGFVYSSEQDEYLTNESKQQHCLSIGFAYKHFLRLPK